MKKSVLPSRFRRESISFQFLFIYIHQSDLFYVVSLNRVEQLEKQQSENLERFKVRTKELKTSVSKELQEATLDAAGIVCDFHYCYCGHFFILQKIIPWISCTMTYVLSMSVYE